MSIIVLIKEVVAVFYMDVAKKYAINTRLKCLAIRPVINQLKLRCVKAVYASFTAVHSL